MGYTQCSLAWLKQEMEEVTDGTHPRKFCFVLGAGASIKSGIPSGQELVKRWDQDLRKRNQKEHEDWLKDNKITDKNMASFYSQYYERRFSRYPRDGYNYMEKIMEKAVPSAGYVMLAYLLTKTPHNVVITTNFDHLTEDSLNYYAHTTAMVIGHEHLAHYVTEQPVRPTVIKIHRDLLFDPKSKKKDLETLSEEWHKPLSMIFKHYNPIFIGYAGNDKSLMDFLIANGEKFAEDEWQFPYWLQYESDILEPKAQEFLEKSNGILIQHNGFDQVMTLLGTTFGYQLPSKEDFLSDAVSRYQNLSESLTKLNAEIAEGDAANNADTAVINEALKTVSTQAERKAQYDRVMDHWRAGQHEQALQELRPLIDQEPENAAYHKLLGHIFRDMKNWNSAISAYQKAAELDDHPNIQYQLGYVYLKSGHLIAATEAYTSAMNRIAEKSSDPFYNVVLLDLASIFTDLECKEKVLEAANLLMASEGKEPIIVRQMSKYLKIAGYEQESKKFLEAAEQLEASI